MGNKLLVISIVRPSLEERSKKAKEALFHMRDWPCLTPIQYFLSSG